MNHGVAADAGVYLGRPGIHAMNGSSGNRAVALVAHLVDIRNVQQPGILGTMRRVTGKAAFRLYRSMFEYKWAPCFRVALGADHVLISRRAELMVAKGPMRVVTVGALHQTFVHLMVEGLRKRRLDVGMAAIAELWL